MAINLPRDLNQLQTN